MPRRPPRTGAACRSNHQLASLANPFQRIPCEHHGVRHQWFSCPMRSGAYRCADEIVVPEIEMVWDDGQQKPCHMVTKDKENEK